MCLMGARNIIAHAHETRMHRTARTHIGAWHFNVAAHGQTHINTRKVLHFN